MNLKFEKKEYVAPKLSFIDMRGEMYLLAGSGDGPDADEYDDELTAMSYVSLSSGARRCVPSSSMFELTQDGSNLYIAFTDNYDESTYADEVSESSPVVNASIPAYPIDGITYTFSTEWINENWADEISEWEI